MFFLFVATDTETTKENKDKLIKTLDLRGFRIFWNFDFNNVVLPDVAKVLFFLIGVVCVVADVSAAAFKARDDKAARGQRFLF